MIARLVAIAIIIHQACQFTVDAANIKREARGSRGSKEVDKEALASDPSSYHHPYGDSFEAIDSRQRPESTLVDPMKMAASK